MLLNKTQLPLRSPTNNCYLRNNGSMSFLQLYLLLTSKLTESVCLSSFITAALFVLLYRDMGIQCWTQGVEFEMSFDIAASTRTQDVDFMSSF